MIAAVAGTFDTKSEELSYIAARIRAAGVDVRTIDLGTTGRGRADISAREVAAFHPDGADAVLASRPCRPRRGIRKLQNSGCSE